MAKQRHGITWLSTYGRQVVTDPLANALNVVVQALVIEVVAATVLVRQAGAVLGQAVDHVELADNCGQLGVFGGVVSSLC